MAVIPDGADLAAWIGVDPVPAATSARFDECIAAAVEDILDRCLADTVDDSSPGGIPQVVRTAMLIYGSRLAKRPTSPEGVAGFNDLGAIRLLPLDVDVESLITRYLKLDGFA